MKQKLLMGAAALLLASSSMFAGWSVNVGVGGGYYGPRTRVVVAGGPVYRPYYRPYYYHPRVYVAPPPVYYEPAPTYWVAGHWAFGPYGRYWVPGHRVCR